MSRICKVTVNEEPFLANCGDLLLDWALMNGVDLPHDCRSGICGACRVHLVDGTVFGGHTSDDMVHACQARIVSDLKIAIEAAPEPVTLSGRVVNTVQLAPDIVGVDVEVSKPLHDLPGQYCKLQFQGFPARSYSPTYPLEGSPQDDLLHFHIRKIAGGMVSPALGREIRAGHRVRLTGPLGRAFFRTGHSGRLVLVASCTGFAPMWSVAVAAIMEQPQRELVFVVAARSIRSLYMHAALCRLALFPNVTLIPLVSEPQQFSHAVRSGRPTDHMPKLSPDDVVYTAGAPALTDAVARVAKAAGAGCYTDPFVPEPRTADQAGLMSRFSGWLNEPRSGPMALQPARKPAPPPATVRSMRQA
jgi:NAD(P)H-flavin reductase/ferredoxin